MATSMNARQKSSDATPALTSRCSAFRAAGSRPRSFASSATSRSAISHSPLAGPGVRLASLRAIGVFGPEVKTPWGGTLDRYIESDRQIPRGFAGGPLIDADGQIIGMNTRTLMRGTDLAIPTSTLQRVVAELQAHGGIRRGYLGVGTYPVDGGALVASVEDGGPAATAGVIVGDTIVELDGVAITGPDSLRTALHDRPGKAIKVAVLRGGNRQELDVTLGAKA